MVYETCFNEHLGNEIILSETAIVEVCKEMVRAVNVYTLPGTNKAVAYLY